MIEAMLIGLGNIFSPLGFGLLVAGVLTGIIVGAMPGLSGITALAIFLPLIVKLDPSVALLLFIGVGAAVQTGNSIPSVLFSIPGTSSAMCTILDGYPMAKKGEGLRALGAAFTASLLGGLIGALFLLATIPVVRPLVLLMGSPELFMVALMGMSVVSTISGRRPLMGLAAACFGLLLSQIGMHPQTGTNRWTFGILYLVDGLPLIPAILGLYGFAEMADLAVKGIPMLQRVDTIGKGLFRGVRDVFHHWFLMVRASLIGVWIGIVPGAGGSTATWLAYAHAVQSAKNRENFGKGDVRGVIAPEAANNASLGGDLLPTLAFGVPGSTSMVLYLAAFTMMGMLPGPEMFTNHLDLIFEMGWGIAMGNLVAAVICMALTTQIIKVVNLPASILVTIIMVFVFIGAAMVSTSMGDLYSLLLFGTIGYTFKKLDWPRPPLVLSMVLGPVLEKYLFISNNAYGASWLMRPSVIILGLLIIAMMVYSMRGRKTQETGGAEAA